MNALLVCMAVATLGIDCGWRRLPEGGLEYIIQIEPQTLDAIRAGQPIHSDIASNLSDIRSYCIMVGTKPLPRDPLPEKTASANQMAAITQEHQVTLPPNKTPPENPPQKLPVAATSKPLAEPSTDGAATSAAEPSTADANAALSDAEESAKPWLPLTLTLFGLFASFGGNMFLGWLVWDLRRRCRSLLGGQAAA